MTVHPGGKCVLTPVTKPFHLDELIRNFFKYKQSIVKFMGLL